MKRMVLLASRNAALQATRSLVLEACGYRTTQVTDQESLLEMAGRIRPEIVILGHSFQPEEQAAMIEQLHETMPGLLVICMRVGVVLPELLLAACAAASDGHPGSQRVRVLGAEDGFHGNGFHRDGLHRDGVHRDGVGADGVHRDGVGADGIHRDGAGADGFHRDGVGADGVHRDGAGADGVRPDALKKLKVASE